MVGGWRLGIGGASPERRMSLRFFLLGSRSVSGSGSVDGEESRETSPSSAEIVARDRAMVWTVDGRPVVGTYLYGVIRALGRV